MTEGRAPSPHKGWHVPKRLTYPQARLMLLALGIAVAVAQTLFAWERGASGTEVLAPVLYVPVFVNAVFWLLPGG